MRHGKQNEVRSGRWKYLNDNGLEYLFDLETDQREQADFKERRPEVLGELKKDFEQWQQHLLPRHQNMD